MDFQERQRVRQAAYTARVRLPPGLGQLVGRELDSWAEFGDRFGAHSTVRDAIDDIMDLPERDSFDGRN